MADSQFIAKFGPPPPRFSDTQILLGHLVLNVGILLVIRPPFVTDSQDCLRFRTITITAASFTAATALLAHTKTSLTDASCGAMEMAYRALRSK